MARRSWRKVGEAGDFPAWVRELDGKSGVYAIRVDGVVRYVGESHTGRLKKTLARHFQHWERKGGWVKTLLGDSDMDPGRTYPREACEVFVMVCEAGRAVQMQRQLIRDLRPADNRMDVPADRVPF